MTLVSQGVMATMNTQQASDYTHTVHAPHQGNRLSSEILPRPKRYVAKHRPHALGPRGIWTPNIKAPGPEPVSTRSVPGGQRHTGSSHTGSSHTGLRRSQHGARIPTLDTEHNDHGSRDLGSSVVSSTPVRSRGARTAPPSPLHYCPSEGSHLCDGSRFALAHATHRRHRAGPISYHHETETTLGLV